MPIAEHVEPVRDVAHGVVRENGVECRGGEGEWLARVDGLKAHALGEAAVLGEPPAIFDAVFVDVDAGDVAASLRGEVDRGSARTAPDLEHARILVHAGEIGEAQPILGGQPAALADVLAERRPPHRRFGAAFKIAIDVVVQID